jgi:hypothetical protein
VFIAHYELDIGQHYFIVASVLLLYRKRDQIQGMYESFAWSLNIKEGKFGGFKV